RRLRRLVVSGRRAAHLSPTARCTSVKINWCRVVRGGLLSGLVLNIVDYVTYGVWLKADMAAAMQALGKQPGALDSAIPVWVALDFVSGIGLLWVYAAIRPRFGAGVKTAVIAGLAVWCVVGVPAAIGESPMGFMPGRLMV